MEPELNDNVKQVVCLAEDYRSDVEQYEAMLKNKTIVFVDYETLQKDYNLVITPTIVALDGQGSISHIQLSHSMENVGRLEFDEELTELLTGGL